MQTCKRHKRSIPFPNELSDKTLEAFLNLMDKHHDPESNEISVDCSKLREVTSSHIGALWSARQRCEANSIEFHLIFPTPDLIRVLQVLDILELFKIDDDSGAIDRKITDFIKTDIIHQKYDDIFNVRIEDINAALRRFESFLLKLKLPKTIGFDLKTVFYEVAHNIYAHGTLTRDDEISFVTEVYKNRIVMEFSDRGMHFDLTSQLMSLNPKKAIDDRRTTGFGLMMIKKLTDSISYVYRDDYMNVLKLEKIWR